MAASDAPVAPLGSSGTAWSNSSFGWPVDDLEHIPEVQWPNSIRTYARMRTDPVIASILACYDTAVIAADWRIDPRGADDAAVKICADSLGLPVMGEKSEPGPVRRRGVKWREHVRLSLLHLVFGAMAFEPVFEVRPDGYAYLSRLPERLPSTITEIKVADDGDLESIVQESPLGKGGPMGVEIPADRLLYYVMNREGSAWQGRSLLRPCYSDWFLKQEVKRGNALGLRRFGVGTPVAEPLPGTNPTPAQIAQAREMVSSIRVGERGGAVPVGFTIRIIGIEGSLPDHLSTLAYHDQQMARACLTSLMDLGNTATGSRALGDNFADILSRALDSTGQRMAETATQLCEKLVDFNFGTDAAVPAISCGDVGSTAGSVAENIVSLITAGAIRPDAELEEFIRAGVGLPAAGTPYVPTPKPGAPAPAPATVPPAPAAPVDTPPADAQAGAQVTAKVAPERHAEGDKGNQGNIRPIIEWFTHGAGAALIQWGAPGDHDRCVALASKHMSVEQAHGFCQLREKETTGLYTSQHAKLIKGSEGAPDQTGIMLALMVPPADAEALALDGKDAEPADDLHLTLAFLGDTSTVEDEAAYVGTVLDVLRAVTARHPVIVGEISGSGRFSTPDRDAVYLSYDSPDLPALRQDLFDSLKAAGVEPAANHGFSPRITLAYVPKGAPSPLDHVEPRSLTFSGVTFAYGGQRLTAPLAEPDAAWPPPGALKLTDEVAIGDFRIVAAAEVAPAESPYRERTPQERAAGIDPAAVDADHDALVAEGMTLFAAIVAVWGAALAAQITATLAAGSLAGLGRLAVDSTDAGQGLAVLMREAADAGVSQVFDELHRAMVSRAPWKGSPRQPHRGSIVVDTAALDDAAAAAADLMGQGLASAAGREAARIAGPDTDPKTVARQAVATVTESDTPIHDAIQAGVTRAMGAGRTAAQQALSLGMDLVPFHVGIRDQAQCTACAGHDGTEYPDLAAAAVDFPTGHYVACLGRARCRCMIGLRPVTP